jgi:putative spermidine/putrescine transport system permease protein
LTAFVRVTLPTIGKGLGAATIFAVVMSFHNFTATFFLTGRRESLPVAVFQYIRTEHDPSIAALTTLMVGAAALIVWVADRWLGLDRIAR